MGWVLFFATLAVAFASVNLGADGAWHGDETTHVLRSWLGLDEPRSRTEATLVALRIKRVLTASAVGGSLALSGALLQGVFRNDLASPSVLGVTAAASVGAALAILVLSGWGSFTAQTELAQSASLVVTAASFAAALGVTLLITFLAGGGVSGRISIPTLLMLGIAINVMAGGILAAIQAAVLGDVDVARAIFAWTFGMLEDRTDAQVALVWGALAIAALVIPFVAFELDLFAAGEDDAQALGVDTRRTKLLAIAAASLAAAVAVSVAGQIAFVGLVVPHLLRLVTGRSHRTLLPFCLLGGALFLVGADALQRWLFPGAHLRPGVVLSLVGGPLFIFLLLRQKSAVRSW